MQMKGGIAALVVGYVLSQFYRACLAVLTADLARDLGASKSDLSAASGLWFLVFALMQFPVGWALDNIGPRRTASVLLALGGGAGSILFAMATEPWHIKAAMALIGVGCSPILMSGYYIFAREYSPRVFATLAGAMVGAGSLGNIASSQPLTAAIAAFGWRGTIWGVAIATLVVALGLAIFIRDPRRAEHAGPRGSFLDLLRMPVIWAVIPMAIVNYVPAAALRGLWVGPWLRDSYGLTSQGVGWATMAMGLAMIAGNFSYGPMDRLFGSHKWVIFAGNAICGLLIVTLGLVALPPLWIGIAMIAAIGFFGASFPLVVAHGRSFAPPHLAGRGVTLMNFFSIGAAGLFQVASGRVFAASGQSYDSLFLFFGLPMLLGCALYLFSRDVRH
jgi:predicted MFS family arabinose efflux permease